MLLMQICGQYRQPLIGIEVHKEVIMAVSGIQFVTDSDGNRVAVLLDLNQWSELWEDIYDNIVAETRREEPKISLDEFEAELRSEGLLNE
jgi:hypothetical protein